MPEKGKKNKYISIIDHNITISLFKIDLELSRSLHSEMTGPSTKHTEQTWVLIPFQPPSLFSISIS